MLKIYTVPNCKWCDKAKEAATEEGFTIEEASFYDPSMWEWEEMIGFIPTTAPQIFVDGVHIGGCMDFLEWLENDA